MSTGKLVTTLLCVISSFTATVNYPLCVCVGTCLAILTAAVNVQHQLDAVYINTRCKHNISTLTRIYLITMYEFAV